MPKRTTGGGGEVEIPGEGPFGHILRGRGTPPEGTLSVTLPLRLRSFPSRYSLVRVSPLRFIILFFFYPLPLFRKHPALAVRNCHFFLISKMEEEVAGRFAEQGMFNSGALSLPSSGNGLRVHGGWTEEGDCRGEEKRRWATEKRRRLKGRGKNW